MTNRRLFLSAGLCALVMFLGVSVQQVAAQATDATGTWKWTQTFGGRRGGGGGGAAGGGAATQPATPPSTQPGAAAAGGRAGRGSGRGLAPREITLKLKQDGEKLTGEILGTNFQDPTAATEIKDGMIKDGEVTFKVVRDFNGTSITTNYKAKLDGDTLKGTTETDFNGNTIAGEIDAKREKAM